MHLYIEYKQWEKHQLGTSRTTTNPKRTTPIKIHKYSTSTPQVRHKYSTSTPQVILPYITKQCLNILMYWKYVVWVHSLYHDFNWHIYSNIFFFLGIIHFHCDCGYCVVARKTSQKKNTLSAVESQSWQLYVNEISQGP